MKKYILIILSMFVLFNTVNGQIIYNKAKPLSYGKQELTKINALPTIKFTVVENGNLSKGNLNINIKKKALIEKIGNKYIARLKISLNVFSFGNITLRFNNIKLNNGSHCYVYTNDYHIVAGPIYAGAINENLNIVQIPAREMLLEILFKEREDFEITLNSIAYQSVSKVSKRIQKQEKLQAVGDYVCPCETHNITHYNIIDSTNYMPTKSQWLGYYANNQLFSLSKLSSINDYDLDAARAACIIMIPNDNNSYDCKTGSLMNFPYDSCHSSFVFASEHQTEIRRIIDTTKAINDNPADTNAVFLLKNTLIRFNWHHKYGTPLHLENIPCDATNFTLWRQTIDFSEVIDYCGVRAFAYRKKWDAYPDIAILKMLSKLIYKEQHLGWSTQEYFKHSHTINIYSPDDTVRSLCSNKFKIMGRKAYSPTLIFDNYEVLFDSYSNGIQAIEIAMQITNPADNYPLPYGSNKLTGWSGSQVLYPHYYDSLQSLSIAMIRGSSGLSNKKYLFAHTYPFIFKGYLYFIDNPLYLGSKKNMYNYYLSNFPNSFNWHYSQHDSLTRWPTDTVMVQDSCYWLPSLENKEKCPSEVGIADTCKFNLSDYMSIDGLCMTISSIPENLFPDGDYPKGYRVYHNFADQKTLDFNTFHSGNDITFPLEFCIDKCDIFYFLNKGMDTLALAIDFYDEFGKIFNNIGCDTASFKFPINMNFCDFIDFSISSDTCCKNEITLNIDGCDNASHWVKTMLDSLSFTNNTTSNTIKLNEIEGIYPDYLNGEITFDYPFYTSGECSIISNFNGGACASDTLIISSCCDSIEIQSHQISFKDFLRTTIYPCQSPGIDILLHNLSSCISDIQMVEVDSNGDSLKSSNINMGTGDPIYYNFNLGLGVHYYKYVYRDEDGNILCESDISTWSCGLNCPDDYIFDINIVPSGPLVCADVTVVEPDSSNCEIYGITIIDPRNPLPLLYIDTRDPNNDPPFDLSTPGKFLTTICADSVLYFDVCLYNADTIMVAGVHYDSTFSSNRGSYEFIGDYSISPTTVDTVIDYTYELLKDTPVNFELYTLQGKLIDKVEFKQEKAGKYKKQYNVSKQKNGIYYAVIRADKEQKILKVIVSH